jgi:hypothetical protein
MRRSLLAALCLALAAGCTTMKPGGACKGRAARCTDKSNAVACEDGKYAAYGCQGALGCQELDGGTVMCDQSAGMAAGAPCAPPYTGFAQCSTDQTAVLVCRDGTWQAAMCPTGTECKNDLTSVWCGV